MGMVQGLGSSFLGAVLAPLVLVPIAVNWGWRNAAAVVAAVALATALLIPGVLARVPIQLNASTGNQSISALAKSPDHARRNVFLCCLISIMTLAWLILTLTFYPTYLVEVRHRPAAEMSVLMSVMGIGGLIASLLVPYLSDRFGRRRTMIVCSLLGTLSPTALLLPYDSAFILSTGLIVGSLAGGTIPLFMAIIPSDSVGMDKLPMTIGMIQGVGEMFGGVLAPALAGWAADLTSPAVPIAMALCSALFAAVLSHGLRGR